MGGSAAVRPGDRIIEGGGEDTEGSVCYKIEIQGLYGGHSGLDINKDRKSANQFNSHIRGNDSVGQRAGKIL